MHTDDSTNLTIISDRKFIFIFCVKNKRTKKITSK